MTKLLDKALDYVRTLSDEEQDELARELLARFDDTAKWDTLLASEKSETWLEGAARAALDARAKGKTSPFDPSDKPT